MAKASKRHNSEYRNFFYALIISKNIYSIKYIKKNRRAGKQLEKVLKSSADRMVLRPCLVERWVVIHETPLQAHNNFGVIAQCLEWWENCIGNNKKGNRDKNIEKRWVKHDNKKRNIKSTSPIIG